MAGVWFHLERVLASPGVPILDEFWITLKRFCGSELFRSEVAPQSGLGVAKSGEPAFGRNPRASQRDKLLRAPQFFEERSRKIHAQNDFIEVVTCSKLLIMSGRNIS